MLIVANFDGGFFRLRRARRIGGTSRIGTVDEAVARIIYFIVADFDGGFFRLRRTRRIVGASRIGAVDETVARVILLIVANFDGGFFRLRRTRRIVGANRIGTVDEAVARVVYFIVADFDGGFIWLRRTHRIVGTSRVGTVDETVARVILLIVANFDGGFFWLCRTRRIVGTSRIGAIDFAIARVVYLIIADFFVLFGDIGGYRDDPIVVILDSSRNAVIGACGVAETRHAGDVFDIADFDKRRPTRIALARSAIGLIVEESTVGNEHVFGFAAIAVLVISIDFTSRWMAQCPLASATTRHPIVAYIRIPRTFAEYARSTFAPLLRVVLVEAAAILRNFARIGEFLPKCSFLIEAKTDEFHIDGEAGRRKPDPFGMR